MLSEAEIDEFLRAFEEKTLPKAKWTHAAHVLTGACYVHTHGEAEAIAFMRARVAAYNVAVGGQNTESAGYHETVTLFWLKLLMRFRREHPHLSRAEFAQAAVAAFANRRDAFRDFYSFDILGSTEARRSWVEPDLQSLY
jgi:hypothetical protein